MLTPKYSESQFIGHLGFKVFQGCCPDAWIIEGTPTQGGDFAFDASLWLAGLGRINGRFSAQVKAGAEVHISGGDDQFISVELTPQVCNLFLQDGNPVLLAFVALESAASSDGAQMFYVWVKDELKKRLGERTKFDESDPANMTIRVPLSNKLTKQLDISEYLQEYWDFNRIAASLSSQHRSAVLRTVSSLTPGGVIGLTQSDSNALSRWLSNESMAGDNLWPVPKPGTPIATLRQLSEQISHGNLSEAERLIAKLRKESLGAEDSSELRFLEGRRALLENDVGSAFEMFSLASEGQPTVPRYYAAQLESAVLLHVGQINDIPSALIDKAKDFPKDSGVTFQLTRIAALRGDYEAAEALIDTLEGASKDKARALYLLIRGAWSEAERDVRNALDRDHSPPDRFLLNALRLRILLNKVTGGEDEIPVGGPLGLRTKDAAELRDRTIEFLRAAQESGWPTNSELALDCATACCAIFGFNREILTLVSDFAKKRPALRFAKEALVQIAMLGDEADIAISNLREIAVPSASDLSRLVMLLSQSEKHSDAVGTAMRLLDQEHSTLVDAAVAMGAISAYRLSAIKEETKLAEFLADADATVQSLYRFISGSIRNPESKAKHLDRLWLDATQGEGDELLQANLILYLRPDRDSDLERIVDLTTRIGERRGLTQLEAAKRAAALLRLEQYDSVVEFTRTAELLYPNDENIGLARAIALDKQGQTPAALEVLTRFTGSDRVDILNAQAQLMLRSGEIEGAINLVKNALAASSLHKDKFHYARVLTTINSKIDRGQYLESARRLGKIVDQCDEEEEGAYLVHFLMAISAADIEIDVAERSEFQQRVRAFSERFPESAFFRVGRIEDGASGDELLAQLQRLAGISEEVVQAQLKAKIFGERAGSHVPFPYRPRLFAPYALNVADLFADTVAGVHRGESSRLIVGNELGLRPLDRPPILDLITLLALVELDLFDNLFGIWTGIAIPKETLAHLAELMFEPSSFRSQALLERVSESLRRNAAKILQPSLANSAEGGYPAGEFATIRAEIASGRYDYLTIDTASAVMLERSLGRCRTVWDFLHVSELKGTVSQDQASLVRLRVASWNSVGTPIKARDLKAVALGAAGSDGMFDLGPAERAVTAYLTSAPLGDSLNGIARCLVELAQNPTPDSERAADWILRIAYREFLILSPQFRGGADALTSQIAVLAVKHSVDAAHKVMEAVWRSLEGVRGSFGGSSEKDSFLKLVGESAANIFDEIARKYGIGVMATEAKFRELLFSLTGPGTQERELLERAYIERTEYLQRRRVSA